MTYYETLGIVKTATVDEIKTAYRKQAMKWHPDRNLDDPVKAEFEFKKINEAYVTLANPEAKRKYDLGLGAKVKRSNRPVFDDDDDDYDYNDFNERAFDEFLRRHHAYGSNYGFVNDDVDIDLKISLVDAFAGVERTVSYTVDGFEKRVKVTVPPGVEAGKKLKCSGGGSSVNQYAPPGDLYITIDILKDAMFDVVGDTLTYKADVSPFDLMLGGQITVPTIEGTHLEIQVRAGTQLRSKIRIPNKGMPKLNSSIRGDLFVEFNMLIPEKLTARQIECLNEARSGSPA